MKEYSFQDAAEDEYVRLVKSNLRSASLYFSHTWDLTNAYQRQKGPVEHVWRQADERFFWNHYVAQDLMSAASIQPLISEYILPVICGFVSLRQTTIGGRPLTFGLITRRSRWRAGTRYFRRGIDDEGNVANFNETEQIVCAPVSDFVDVQVFSYVQTRGSIPAHWAEVNNLRYRPHMKIGGSSSFSAKKHFAQQQAIYGKNYLVNLVNQKGYELPIKLEYERLVENLNDPNLDYVYFDFHHECKNMRYLRIFRLIEELCKRGLEEQGWFQARIGIEGSTVEKTQSSVIRSNCMDCLDRTNVVQSTFARWVLNRQLKEAGIVSPGGLFEEDKHFDKIFMNVWADNADSVSKSYSGTRALKTDVTRTSQRTVLGAIRDFNNSAMRYALNNFSDGARQDGFDLFLGNHFPFETIDSPFTDQRPVSYQVMPYVLFGSTILSISAYLCPKEGSSWTLNKIFVLVCAALCLYSLKFIAQNGMQYVNWPKLLPLDFVRKVSVPGRNKAFVMVEADTPDFNPGTLEEGKRE